MTVLFSRRNVHFGVVRRRSPALAPRNIPDPSKGEPPLRPGSSLTLPAKPARTTLLSHPRRPHQPVKRSRSFNNGDGSESESEDFEGEEVVRANWMQRPIVVRGTKRRIRERTLTQCCRFSC